MHERATSNRHNLPALLQRSYDDLITQSAKLEQRAASLNSLPPGRREIERRGIHVERITLAEKMAGIKAVLDKKGGGAK